MEEFRRKFKFVIHGRRVSVKKLPLKKKKQKIFVWCLYNQAFGVTVLC